MARYDCSTVEELLRRFKEAGKYDIVAQLHKIQREREPVDLNFQYGGAASEQYTQTLLVGIMDWSETPQGHAYWYAIHESLDKHTRVIKESLDTL